MTKLPSLDFDVDRPTAMSTFVSQLPSHLLYHARTAILFTLADIKTIFFPIVRPPGRPPLSLR